MVLKNETSESNISWADHVKKELLCRIKEERNILYKIKEGRLST